MPLLIEDILKGFMAVSTIWMLGGALLHKPRRFPYRRIKDPHILGHGGGVRRA